MIFVYKVQMLHFFRWLHTFCSNVIRTLGPKLCAWYRFTDPEVWSKLMVKTSRQTQANQFWNCFLCVAPCPCQIGALCFGEHRHWAKGSINTPLSFWPLDHSTFTLSVNNQNYWQLYPRCMGFIILINFVPGQIHICIQYILIIPTIHLAIITVYPSSSTQITYMLVHFALSPIEFNQSWQWSWVWSSNHPSPRIYQQSIVKE